jgi:glycosyltransferase involved in cell wall biosynthesis
MKIAIFTELYSPSIGGQEVRYEELASILVSRSHEVSVYCIGHTKNLLPKENINEVEVFRHPIVDDYKNPIIKPLKRSIVPLIRYSLWISKILSHEHFDFIIFNQWPLLHIVLSPKNNRTHSIIDWCEVRKGKFYQLCQKNLPKLSHFNMAVSQTVCKNIEKVSGKSVFYLPSGINRDRYSYCPFKDRSDILYLGRIAEHKNLALLIEAFELLCGTNFHGNLQIAGQGITLERLKLQASNSKYSDRIYLLGSVTEDEKINLLSKSKLLVIPSKREGFPRIVAEAMASGLPVVTTQYPENGTADVLSLYNCGYISQPSSRSLCETMQQAILDWDKLSRSGLNRAHELDWETLVDSLEKQVMMQLKVANS